VIYSPVGFTQTSIYATQVKSGFPDITKALLKTPDVGENTFFVGQKKRFSLTFSPILPQDSSSLDVFFRGAKQGDTVIFGIPFMPASMSCIGFIDTANIITIRIYNGSTDIFNPGPLMFSIFVSPN
jgi:hypothetical protein